MERPRNEKGQLVTVHGMSNSKIYWRWNGMKNRCGNPHHKEYAAYGGRGITVCDEWRNSFSAFYKWAMANGYSDDLTIDRIDNNRGYSPDNCRFITRQEQNRNTSRNVMITYNGKTQCLQDWANETGIGFKKLQWRLKAGYPIEILFDKRNWRYKDGRETIKRFRDIK